MASGDAKGHDYLCNVALFGASGAGKSATRFRFANPQVSFPTELMRWGPFNIDFTVRTIAVDDGKATVKLRVWDTAGGERYREIWEPYCRCAHGVLVLYNVNFAASFEVATTTHVRQMIDKHTRKDDTVVMLVGCCGLDVHPVHGEMPQRQVSFEQGAHAAAELGWMFTELNPVDGTNVEEAFTTVASRIIGYKRARERVLAFVKALEESDYMEAHRLLKEDVALASDKLAVVVAAACGDRDRIATLLSANVDPNSCFSLSGGGTALHLAAAAGHHNTVSLLIRAGADPYAKDFARRTPMDLASGATRLVMNAALGWQHAHRDSGVECSPDVDDTEPPTGSVQYIP
jgi:small GTP-binding protein